MASNLKPRLRSYAEPLVLLSISLLFLAISIATHPLLLITSPSSFRSKWFQSFWVFLGPKMSANPRQVEYVGDLMSRAQGTVLELGPGGGDQSRHYRPSQITRVYGVEPNVYLHEKLLASADKAGLGNGTYVALAAGAQPDLLIPALRKQGLIPSTGTSLPEDGIFDSIVVVKSICSLPQQQLAATLAVLQALMKPGAELLFFEHLENNTDTITQIYTWFLGWIWPLAAGGCRLDSKLDQVILGMGGWSDRQLSTIQEFQGFEVFRYVKGICRKG